MKTRTHKLLLVFIGSLITSGLAGCVSVKTPKQNLVVYDFGLSAFNEGHSSITSEILLEEPSVADALNHNKIRYRLNYQNPSRIFLYSESRWASRPSALLSSKISQMVSFNKMPTNCSLRLKIEAFDHVFQTTEDSHGVVQLSASVVERGSRKMVASQLITEKMTASTPNAEGGVAAIQHASETALNEAIAWGNNVLGNNEQCQ